MLEIYNNNESTIYDKVIQTAAMTALVGVFVTAYNHSNFNVDIRKGDVPRKPTIEAILNKEEKLFELPEVKDPGNKKKGHDRHGLESGMYVGPI